MLYVHALHWAHARPRHPSHPSPFANSHLKRGAPPPSLSRWSLNPSPHNYNSMRGLRLPTHTTPPSATRLYRSPSSSAGACSYSAALAACSRSSLAAPHVQTAGIATGCPTPASGKVAPKVAPKVALLGVERDCGARENHRNTDNGLWCYSDSVRSGHAGSSLPFCQLSGVVAGDNHVFVSDFDQDLVHVFEVVTLG